MQYTMIKQTALLFHIQEKRGVNKLAYLPKLSGTAVDATMTLNNGLNNWTLSK